MPPWRWPPLALRAVFVALFAVLASGCTSIEAKLDPSGEQLVVGTSYGIEHAFLPNWTVKGEYIYFDLGRDTVNVAVIPGSGGGGTGYNSTFRNDGHIGRVGLNYRFGPM